MNDIELAIQGVRTGIKLLRDAIGLVKDSKDLLPESKDKDAIEEGLREAEKASKLAESQIALALGYTLCKCTFPPQIMLSKGYKDHKENFVCQQCGKSSFPPEIEASIPEAYSAFKNS